MIRFSKHHTIIDPSRRNSPIIHALFLVLLISFIYSNVYHVPFQWDEEMHIVNEPIVKDLKYFISPSKAQGFENYNFFISRYITHLTFALNYRIHGLSVPGYHVANNTIHILNAILVYWFILLIFQSPFMAGSLLKTNSRYVALYSALLFAIHPLQTGAVTYVMQRFVSLATFFYLLSLATYVKFRLMSHEHIMNGRALFFYIISVISSILAMKSKETAFTLPFVITMTEFCFFKGDIKKRMILAPILLTLSVIPLTLMTMKQALGSVSSSMIDPGSYMAGFIWDYEWTEYVLSQFRVIVTYLRMLFFPVHLDLDYEYPVYHLFSEPQVFMSFVLLGLVFAAGLYLVVSGRGRVTEGDHAPERLLPIRCSPDIRLMGFGILWFFMTLSVESIITTPRLIETYRVYLPSIGMIVFAVVGFLLVKEKARSPHLRRVLMGFFSVTVILLSFATYAQNNHYKDSRKMWEDTVKRFPRYASARVRLGVFYSDHGMPEKAVDQYLMAIKLKPDYVEAYNNLGNVYGTLKMPEKAVEQYLMAIRFKPDYAEAHNNLGNVYYAFFKLPEKAVEQYLMAIRYKPDYAEAHNNLCHVYTSFNMNEKAIAQCSIAIKLKPGYFKAHYNLAVAYFQARQLENARIQLASCLQIKPDFELAQQLLRIVNSTLMH